MHFGPRVTFRGRAVWDTERENRSIYSLTASWRSQLHQPHIHDFLLPEQRKIKFCCCSWNAPRFWYCVTSASEKRTCESSDHLSAIASQGAQHLAIRGFVWLDQWYQVSIHLGIRVSAICTVRQFGWKHFSLPKILHTNKEANINILPFKHKITWHSHSRKHFCTC